MKSRSVTLAERSLNSVLSAIEIYNKPNFLDREQVFSILLTVGWEVLLKARIVQLNQNRLNSIWIKHGHRYKLNRTKGKMTISITESLNFLKLDPVVEANIERLVEVRDAATHLSAASEALPYLAYSLGAASLRNYSTLISQWFAFDLAKFNFYILPLGFSYPFATFQPAQLSKEPKDILQILEAVLSDQTAGKAQSGEFHLVCEIRTNLVSAKKVTTQTDLTAALGQLGSPDITVIHKTQNRLDKYPLSFTQLCQKIKVALPAAKQTDVQNAIKALKVKGAEAYSAYSYRTKQDEAKGPTKNTTCIYNEDAYKLLLTHLQKA